MKALLPLAVQVVMTSQRAAEQREKMRLRLFLRFFVFYFRPCAFGFVSSVFATLRLPLQAHPVLCTELRAGSGSLA